MSNEYDELYKNSYGDLNPDSGGFDGGDNSDMFAEMQKAIMGDGGSFNSPTTADSYYGAPKKSASVYDPVPNGLDPKIAKIVRAIRTVESGGNYQAKGASGEFGAYQFMPATWKQWAGEFLGNPNAEMSKENQNQVAYKKVESLAKAGHSPDQIASIWNSGQPDYEGKVGTNQFGVAYNVPEYVKKVMQIALTPVPTANAQEPQNGTPLGPIQPTAPTPTPEPEKKSLGGFAWNALKSGGNFLGSLGNIALHPVDTVTNLGKLAWGVNDLAYSKLGLTDGKGEGADMARGLGNMYKERYGGLDNIGNTLYNDPVGVLADVATIFSGGAGAASKLGIVGKLGEAGKLGTVSDIASNLNKANDVSSVLTKVAKASDPLTYISKAVSGANNSKVGEFVKNIPSNAIGISTGQGGGTFRQIFDAAKNKRGGAIDAMRGGVNADDIVTKLDSAVSAIKGQARKAWEDLGIDNIKGSLDVSPIFTKLKDGLENMKIVKGADGALDFSRSTIRFDRKAQGDIQHIVDTMRDFGTRTGDRLPSGVDSMKQSFASLYTDSGASRPFVQSMTKATRDVLGKVKGYNEYTQKYGEVQDMLGQLKTELSAGNKNASQTWRKLVNTFKQRNTEGRVSMLQELQDSGVSDVIDNIAGYGAKELLPSDIVRSGVLPTLSVTSGNLLSIPAFSPRLMGELSNLLGKTVGSTQGVVEKAGTLKGADLVKYLGGQVYDKTKATRAATLIERMRESQQESEQEQTQ